MFSPSGKLKRALALLALSVLPMSASASMFAGEALDNVANYLAWFIVFVMPVVGIVVFWKIHILPEKIAEKRHHPQKDAIQVLCLLSLVFGGLLWPIAWLWAYTRPTTSYLAYGTEKHEDYFHEMAQEWRAGKLTRAEAEELEEELDAVASKARLPASLKAFRRELAAAHAAQADAAVSGGTA
jgi:CBS domain containing-hemolysin-like protein